MKKYDVLAAGYYGFGNLGDELLAASVVAQLDAAGVDRRRIALLSADPAAESASQGVDCFNRWRMEEVFSAMHSSRTLLLGGGGLFQDSTSVKSCVYYWGLVKMARAAGLAAWSAGQSIGPLRSSAASFLAKSAFSSCRFRGVRDSRSLDVLKSWGMDGWLSQDLATGLRVRKDFAGGRTLLLNLRPGYEKLAAAAASGAAAYARGKGLKVAGVAFAAEDAAELKKYVDNGVLELVQITVVKNLHDYENILDGCCRAVGMRLHFVVLSVLAGLPTAAVAYDPKVASFCSDWNVPLFAAEEPGFSDPLKTAGLAANAEQNIQAMFRAGLAAAIGD